MADWETLTSDSIYETSWIRIRRDEVLNHTGKPLTYSVVELRHPSVFIVATNSQGNALLQRNYRYPIGNYAWDLPAGHAEEGETLLQAAKRELQEETGLGAEDWIELNLVYQATGIGNIPAKVFLARNVHPMKGERDKLEDIAEQRYVDDNTIDEWIKSGKIDTSVTIAALYLARLHKQKEK